MICYAFTDGGSRGNPGDSGIGVIVKNESGEIVFSTSGYIGQATNNVAEYSALLLLLRKMKSTSCSHLIAHSDSELMVRQINGEYRVKDEVLKKYFQRVIGLIENAPFRFELKHVPREQNKEADQLANRGIDSKKLVKV
ncbi:MAG: ribonuclease HI family protein [Bacteroidota bacterium]